MLQKEKPSIEQNEDVYIFLVSLKYHIFLFSTAQQKMVTCLPEDKLSYIYPDHQILKVFTPRLLIMQ